MFGGYSQRLGRPPTPGQPGAAEAVRVGAVFSDADVTRDGDRCDVYTLVCGITQPCGARVGSAAAAGSNATYAFFWHRPTVHPAPTYTSPVDVALYGPYVAKTAILPRLRSGASA